MNKYPPLKALKMMLPPQREGGYCCREATVEDAATGEAKEEAAALEDIAVEVEAATEEDAVEEDAC